MTKGGLLIAGVIVPVEGLDIANPTDTPWCKLDPGDYKRRQTAWIRQVIVHGTRGGWPQGILPGAGAGGRDKIVAEFWRKDPEHSAAPLVVDTDGTVACLCDLAYFAPYHATVSNDWSVGIEMAQVGASDVYEATIAATVRLVRALCEQFSIPFQIPTAYRNKPLERMLTGGKDCVGVFGHRENTHRRGRGDPGDAIMVALEQATAERFDFDAGHDLSAWKLRQAKLNAMGEKLTVDGVAGPSTMAALRRHGFASGRELDAAVETQ